MSKDWNDRYLTRDMPWDSGLRSRELRRVLKEDGIAPCRAVELGCGTGTNAIYLASQGFDVTAFDLAEAAVEEARRKAAAEGARVTFQQADLCRLEMPDEAERFDFVFDRGCYHCVRKVDLDGYRNTLARLAKPGARYLLLTGNADAPGDQGPPRVTREEIAEELGSMFEVLRIRPFHFEDAGHVDGPLGWSALLQRRQTRKP